MSERVILHSDMNCFYASVEMLHRFSQMAREIYSEYTDKIEPYGIDEAWVRP